MKPVELPAHVQGGLVSCAVPRLSIPLEGLFYWVEPLMMV
jgi:hypothetical protein